MSSFNLFFFILWLYTLQMQADNSGCFVHEYMVRLKTDYEDCAHSEGIKNEWRIAKCVLKKLQIIPGDMAEKCFDSEKYRNQTIENMTDKDNKLKAAIVFDDCKKNETIYDSCNDYFVCIRNGIEQICYPDT